MGTKERDTILIIDDDNRNIFALQLILKSRKLKCISALSAKEGLVLLQNNDEVGLVFMDMMMPEMDGYEAIKVVKESADYPKVPVIAVTAQAMEGDREKCIAAGADDYIVKPIQVNDLMDVISKWL